MELEFGVAETLKQIALDEEIKLTFSNIHRCINLCSRLLYASLGVRHWQTV
jgi:hypothetical protein